MAGNWSDRSDALCNHDSLETSKYTEIFSIPIDQTNYKAFEQSFIFPTVSANMNLNQYRECCFVWIKVPTLLVCFHCFDQYWPEFRIDHFGQYFGLIISASTYNRRRTRSLKSSGVSGQFCNFVKMAVAFSKYFVTDTN